MIEFLTFISPILVTLAVFIISYVPGRILLNRFSFLNQREKFALSFLVSCILIYLPGFICYILFPKSFSAYRILFLLILAGFLLSLKRIKIIISDKTERRLLLFALLMLFWLVAFHSLHRCYGGGGWGGDWYEHYERSLFLSAHYDRNYQFLDIYDFPARPPLFNLVCSFFFSIFGSSFWIFQIICSFLNMTLVLGAWLLIAQIFPSLKKSPLIAFIALFMLDVPMVRQMIYTMTKGLAGAYVLAGAAVYLKGRKDFDLRYLSLAFLLLSAGVLAHYSAAPFFLAISMDLALVFFIKPDRKKFISLVAVVLLSSAFLFSWLTYSIAFYGTQKTFLSNTTYTESKNLTLGKRISKDLYNLRATFLPSIHKPEYFSRLPRALKLIQVYDMAIMFYSESLTGNAGLTLSVFLLILFAVKMKSVIGFIRNNARNPSALLFWVLFLGMGGMMAIASNGGLMPHGAAHVSFVPIGALLLLFAWHCAKQIQNRFLRLIIALGILIESFVVFALRIIVLSSLFINLTTLYKSANHFGNFAVRDVRNLEFLEGIYSSLSWFILALTLAGWFLWATIFIKDMLHTEVKERLS
ncbi:hypothetical protein JW926_09610 [Candidatus Sumerlaeota bacterium]|nr:hypothetical protein [Candidatus Sumerlaeota bacterium]